MPGIVQCKLIGGPDGDSIAIPAFYCKDRISIVQEGWYGEGANGTVLAMKGMVQRKAPWISFPRALYEKLPSSERGGVTYKFIRIEQVDRCEKVLVAQARRCKNEAEQGKRFCRAHRLTD